MVGKRTNNSVWIEHHFTESRDHEHMGDDQQDDAESEQFSRSSLSPGDIQPVGAMIAVAFTGASIGLVGGGVSLVAAELGYVLILLGVVIVFSSPVAYVRFRNLREK